MLRYGINELDCTINVYAFGKARHFRTAFCATEVVPFGSVPSIPIQEQKLEICPPPVQDDTILGPILQTVSTLPEGLDLSTSCLLCSHDMGLNMLAKPKLPMVHHYFLMKMPNPVCDMM